MNEGQQIDIGVIASEYVQTIAQLQLRLAQKAIEEAGLRAQLAALQEKSSG